MVDKYRISGSEAAKDRALVKRSQQRGPYILNGLIGTACAFTLAPFVVGFFYPPVESAQASTSLRRVISAQPCVLESTEYDTTVSGYLATVTVKQRFSNPNTEKMSATYTFPLSDRAAIDQMTMKIGDRTLQAVLKESQAAKLAYEQAKQNGQSASLLEQYRKNIFTQSVANIDAGQPIEIITKYTEELPFYNGKYSLTLPTQVGPRFIPDGCNFDPYISRGHQGLNTENCAVSVKMNLNEGGIPISRISSPTHSIAVAQSDPSHASISMSEEIKLGKDIQVDWQVSAEESLESGYLTHKKGTEGYMTAMIVPPKELARKNVAPKEMIFIVDCSGSQAGQPLDKAKETLHYIVDHMNPQDTFQIIKFADQISSFSPKPISVNDKNRREAHNYIKHIAAQGGTVMAPAIESACSIPVSPHRLRIVTLMTDGFIGNDYEVIGMVKRLRGNSRWFPFGTGNSVNRNLINEIAKEGGGEPEFVLLNSSASKVGKHFYDRISSPVLTNVEVSFEGVSPSELYPKEIADVWEQRPLYFQAKYEKGGKGSMVISGFASGKPYKKRLPILLPASESRNSSLPKLWGRAKIDQLYSDSWDGTSSNRFLDERFKSQVINTSLKYNVLSEFTSFVAVEENLDKNSLLSLKAITHPTSVMQDIANSLLSIQLPTASLEPVFAVLDLPKQIERSFQSIMDSQAGLIRSQLNSLNSVSSTNAPSSNFVPAPIAMGGSYAPQVATPINQSSSSGGPDAFDSTCATGNPTGNSGHYSGAPSQTRGYASASMLQGATNGTIGPQPSSSNISSSSPSYAQPLSLVGVNTAGTISSGGSQSPSQDAGLFETAQRPAWIVQLLHNLAALAQYAWVLLAAYLFFNARYGALLTNAKRQEMQIACAALLIIALNMPNTIQWLIAGLS
ncbi:MAG: VIT and VWA domain-containing protein [Candidatus Obscuribacterales bacterium]|jgi:Ca-activated chloride channel family protein|nr:VIT and VWA domain-containing protein [Candidatus Obscuribacterales bacterium]